MRVGRNNYRWMARGAIFAIAVGIFCGSIAEQPELTKGTGVPQLVAIHELPDYGDVCEPSSIQEPEYTNRFGAFGPSSVYAGSQVSGQTGLITRPPVRQIRDLDPIYSGVAVDTTTDEVILGDNNHWAIRIFNRLDNTPPGAPFSEPKRVITGLKTEIQFINGLYVDPNNGDIHVVESDTGDKVTVFSRDANGDVAPKRILQVPHRGFSLAVDEQKQELLVGVHYPPQVAVYRKNASNDEKPLRSFQGESTRLAYAQGIAIDPKSRLLFVANWGRISDYKLPGTGRFEDPSITVYPLDAGTDTPPLRVIQGERTQLNWPAQIAFDPDTNDLYVANDTGQSVLVFKGTDRGNVAPTRVIKGDRTGLMNPHGIFVDRKNRELWVANFGNSSAVVYPLGANGNVAPLRKIRSAPRDKVSLKFGKVEALAYDPTRDQIWVPN